MDSESTSYSVTGAISFIFSMLRKVGTATAAVACCVAVLLYFKQESLLYFPEIGGLSRRTEGNPRGYRSPRERQIPFESVMITCQDGVRIHAWLIKYSETETSPTIIFFHGNAGNIGLRLPNAIQMRQQLQANILLVEYRGYGDSESFPSEKGLRLDSEAALKYCQSHASIDPTQVFVFGRSLGGAVAFHMAYYAQQNAIPLSGVIVENTFTSISAMVDKILPFLAPFKALVLTIGWKSIDIVPHLNIPTLYLAGNRDEIVPHEHMLELYRLHAKGMAHMHVIDDGTHNESWVYGGPAYWEAIRKFMRMLGSSGSVEGNCDADSYVPSGNKIPAMATNIVGMARNEMSSPNDPDKKKD